VSSAQAFEYLIYGVRELNGYTHTLVALFGFFLQFVLEGDWETEDFSAKKF
jgi:hypothetical protein